MKRSIFFLLMFWVLSGCRDMSYLAQETITQQESVRIPKLNCYYPIDSTYTAYVNFVNDLGYAALDNLKTNIKETLYNLAIAPPGLFSLYVCHENNLEPHISQPIKLLHIPDSLNSPKDMLNFMNREMLDSQNNYVQDADSTINIIEYSLKHPFYEDREHTDIYTFCQKDGSMSSTLMRYVNQFNCKYCEDEFAQLVMLPLDDFFNLFILLPKNSAHNPIDLLEPKKHHNLLYNRDWETVNLLMPTMNIKTRIDISSLFSSTNIQQDIQFKISPKAPRQDSRTDSNEMPLTAIYKKKIKPQKAKSFYANRPFAYILQDRYTGIYLLMGVIEKFE